MRNKVSKTENSVLPGSGQMTLQPQPLPQSSPPIGGGYQGKFTIFNVAEIPHYSDNTWQFVIDGLVSNTTTLTWEEFLKLPRKVQVCDFHCVTGWSVHNVTYEGVTLSALLKMVQVESDAKFVKFYSGDGVYTDTLSLNQALKEDIMVALLMDGKPIDPKQGGPARLIVPGMYGYKSLKYLIRMELSKELDKGYWEQQGYEVDAWVTHV